MTDTPRPQRTLLHRIIASKTFYAACFCLILPLLIVWGCFRLEPSVTLPPLHSPFIGTVVAFLGLGGMAAAMLNLKIQGGGLPMNGFPAPRFVATGIYRLVPHPIYTCSVILAAGASVATGSAAGLYIFTPLIALGCAAIVWGYERQDLIRRFGTSSPPTWLSLPPPGHRHNTAFERLRAFLLPAIVWTALYFLGGHMILTEGAPSCRILGEQATPVIQQAGWIYVSIYPVLLLVILLQHSDALMRSFASSGILACALAFLVYILFPLSCPFLPFEPTTVGGRLLEWERSVDLNGGIAFPSYHALWAFLMLAALWRAIPGNIPRLLMLLWTLALCWSCVATGMHGWIDIIASALLTAGVLLRVPILRSIIRLSECLANSWHAWRIGPLRIINHAIYTFLAAAGGYYLVLALAGPPYLLASGIVTICSLAGAGIWAQLIEGSSQLLRPFGYYGAILGGIAGILLIATTSPLLPENGNDPWIIFGAMAAAAPWIQAIGRIRCIVQGCCHGRPVHTCHTHLGLRHTNPSSRVCALSPYTGIPLHATPLYSIAFNLLIGTILLRLWTASASVALIAGLYFALAGLSRFVEEAYRGEPQTRRAWGLTEYQWLAVAFVLAAFVIWSLPGGAAPAPAPDWLNATYWLALPVGLLYAFAMSMDFPNSHRRYSRLTG